MFDKESDERAARRVEDRLNGPYDLDAAIRAGKEEVRKKNVEEALNTLPKHVINSIMTGYLNPCGLQDGDENE